MSRKTIKTTHPRKNQQKRPPSLSQWVFFKGVDHDAAIVDIRRQERPLISIAKVMSRYLVAIDLVNGFSGRNSWQFTNIGRLAIHEIMSRYRHKTTSQFHHATRYICACYYSLDDAIAVANALTNLPENSLEKL